MAENASTPRPRAGVVALWLPRPFERRDARDSRHGRAAMPFWSAGYDENRILCGRQIRSIDLASGTTSISTESSAVARARRGIVRAISVFAAVTARSAHALVMCVIRIDLGPFTTLEQGETSTYLAVVSSRWPTRHLSGHVVAGVALGHLDRIAR
jgi:hypothetical protein